jgi:hypothetical protein
MAASPSGEGLAAIRQKTIAPLSLNALLVTTKIIDAHEAPA